MWSVKTNPVPGSWGRPPGPRCRPGRRFPGRWDSAVFYGIHLVEAAGSKREGMRNMSAPASIRWARHCGATFTPSLPGYLGASAPASGDIFPPGAQNHYHQVQGQELRNTRPPGRSLSGRSGGRSWPGRGPCPVSVQPEGLHQGRLVLGLAHEFRRAELGGKQVVVLRAPVLVVHAVENAVNGGGAVAEHPLQPQPNSAVWISWL